MNNWYKIITSSLIGTDPFGASEISQKTSVSPYGNAGGDSHFGLFEPSSGAHAANDYFSEDDKTPSIEKRLKELKEKKQKENSKKKLTFRRIKRKRNYKKANLEEDNYISEEESQYVGQIINKINNALSYDPELVSLCQLSWDLTMAKRKVPSGSTRHDITQTESALIGLLSFVGKNQDFKGKTLEQIKSYNIEFYNDLMRTKLKAENWLITLNREYNQQTKSLQTYDAARRFMDNLRREEEFNYAKNKNWYKNAQWGTNGPKMPTWTTPPEGGNESNWVLDTFKELSSSEQNAEQKMEGNSIKNSLNTATEATVTIQSYGHKGNEIGSGFFIGPNVILTCSHVVNPNGETANKLTVKFKNTEYDAVIFTEDKSNDVVVLVLKDKNFKVGNYLKLGSSNEVNMGDEIIIFGTPLGFENVVEKGIISSQPVDYVEENGKKSYFFISAKISPGNSGGPVIREMDNKVIGIAAAVINTQDATGGGLNAAIPIDQIKPFLKSNGVKYEE
jgi:V8-like Glu-specific endopeptidase